MKFLFYIIILTCSINNAFSQKINLQNHFGEITNFIASDSFLATSSSDNTVKIWKKDECIKTLQFNSKINSFKEHPYNSDIILIHSSEKVVFYNYLKGNIEQVIRFKTKGYPKTASSSFTKNKKYMLANLLDNNTLSLVDLKTKKIKTNLDSLHSGFLIDQVLTTDNKMLISVDNTGIVVCWDMVNYTPIKIFKLENREENIKLTLDEDKVFFYNTSNKIYGIDLKSLETLSKEDYSINVLSNFYQYKDFVCTKTNNFLIGSKYDNPIYYDDAEIIQNNEMISQENNTFNLLKASNITIQNLEDIYFLNKLETIVKKHKDLENFTRIKLEHQNFLLLQRTLNEDMPNQNTLIKIWDIKQQKMISEIRNRGLIFDFTLSKDSLLAIVGSDVQVFDLKKEDLRIFKMNSKNMFGWMYNVFFCNEDKNLFVNGQSSNILFFNYRLKTEKPISNDVKVRSNDIPYLNLSKTKITTVSEKAITTWDLKNYTVSYCYPLSEKLAITSILAEDNIICIGLANNEISIINTKKKQA